MIRKEYDVVMHMVLGAVLSEERVVSNHFCSLSRTIFSKYANNKMKDNAHYSKE